MQDADGREQMETHNDIAISVKKVSKTFYPLRAYVPFLGAKVRGFTSVDDVSFEVATGEMVGLLGPNGAGKTTLLKILSTLILPSHGEVLFFGKDHRQPREQTRGLLGLVTCDERSFYWRLTGWQNLMFFAALYRVPKEVARKRGMELLDTLGLAHAAHERFDRYSAGMKQKLSIARGLISDPRIVLYDEPTRSLDPLSQKSIREWIREKRLSSPEQTHLVATHHLSEAEDLCDRVMIMSRGKLVTTGDVESLRQKFPVHTGKLHEVVVHWQADASMDGFVTELASRPGVELTARENDGPRTLYSVTTYGESVALSDVFHLAAKNGGIIEQVQSRKDSLDDLFCSLVDKDQAREVVAETPTPEQAGRHGE